MRNPAHADFGTLTLLFQDEAGGLEIVDPSFLSDGGFRSADAERNGRFVPVEPRKGTVVVMGGYLLMRWSNGRWMNTIHRVMKPSGWKEEGAGSSDGSIDTEEGGEDVDVVPERYSVVYFSVPDPDTVVETFPSCCAGQASRWKPINAGEYLRRKRAAMYE